MKKLVAILAFLTLLTTSPAGIHAKTLRLALDSDPPCLDYMSQLSGNLLSYAEWAFDPLVRWSADMKLEARLAEKWEWRDPTTLRVHLRRGVMFHSGNPMTAADVKWTFERLRRAPEWKHLFESFRDCVLVDDHCVDFVFVHPEPLALNLLTYVFPMDSLFYSGQDAQGSDKSLVSENDPVFANLHASGTGPFKVVSHEPQVKMVLARNTGYWDRQSRGNIGRIELIPIKDSHARTTALLSGDADLISPVDPRDQDLVRKSPGFSLVNLPSTRVITVGFNPVASPEFRDARVRRAVIAAVDNAGIVDKIMDRLTVPANQFSAKGMSGYNPGLKSRYDPDKARKLLAEAGFDKGFAVSMIAPDNRYTNDQKIAEAIVAMLARINITVHLKTMPVAQFWPEFQKRQAGLQMVGWLPDTGDSANYFEYLIFCNNDATGEGAYNTGYCNPGLDDLVRSANKEPDPAKRSRMLKDAEKMACDDGASITLHYEPMSWAARKNVKLETCINLQNFLYLGDLVVE